MQNKYQEVLNTYAPTMGEKEILNTVENILSKKFDENNTVDVKKFLYGTIDLTTLNGADTDESVAAFTQGVNDFDGQDPTIPNVAAICVYPNFVKTVKSVLTTEKVNIACVSGCFPASQSFLEVKIAETSLAVRDGADEIDIVLNLNAFLSEDYETAATEIEEQKAACRDAHLKVILETGALKSPELIRNASIISLYSGADFLKTSTGKEYEGASLLAAYVMCNVVKEYYQKHNEKKGLKFSGGIRTAKQAVEYYTIVKEVLGEEWLTPELFRLGASSLAGSLKAEIL